MVDDFTLDLADEAATLAFGTSLAKAIEPNLTIYLHGDLGAGKTTLVRGLLHGLGFAGKVKSPTYTLVEPYDINLNPAQPFSLYHFDLYRFNDEEEWEAAGFRDYFNSGSVCLIEWPEKAAHILPTPDIDVSFNIKGAGRVVALSARSEHGRGCVRKVKS